MDLTEQARRVLQALEAKPDLFFEVLRLAQDEFLIAGPWIMSQTPGCWHRETVLSGTQPLGEIYYNNVGTYSWRCGPEQGADADAIRARDIVDNLLTEQGYLLCKGSG